MIDYDDISPELQEKAKQCKTAEELAALAESEGIDLSDEQLEALSAGADGWICLTLRCIEQVSEFPTIP